MSEEEQEKSEFPPESVIPPEMKERRELVPIYVLGAIYCIIGGWPLAELAVDPVVGTKIRVAVSNLGLFLTMWGLGLLAISLVGGVGLFLRERWGKTLIIIYSAGIIPTRSYFLIRELVQSTAPVDTTNIAQNIIYILLSIFVIRYLVRPKTSELFHPPG